MDRAYAKEIPIVAMSANAFAEDIMNSKNAGMNEHITKPIDIDELARVLSLYVKQARIQAENRRPAAGSHKRAGCPLSRRILSYCN